MFCLRGRNRKFSIKFSYKNDTYLSSNSNNFFGKYFFEILGLAYVCCAKSCAKVNKSFKDKERTFSFKLFYFFANLCYSLSIEAVRPIFCKKRQFVSISFHLWQPIRFFAQLVEHRFCIKISQGTVLVYQKKSYSNCWIEFELVY